MAKNSYKKFNAGYYYEDSGTNYALIIALSLLALMSGLIIGYVKAVF